MNILYVLCPLAIVLVALTNLIGGGDKSGEVQETMKRRGSAERSSTAPIAPKVKFNPTATVVGGKVVDAPTPADPAAVEAGTEQLLPTAA